MAFRQRLSPAVLLLRQAEAQAWASRPRTTRRGGDRQGQCIQQGSDECLEQLFEELVLKAVRGGARQRAVGTSIE